MKTDILLTTGPKLCEIEDFEKTLLQGYKSYRIHLGKKKRDNFQIINNIKRAGDNTEKKPEIYLDIPSDRLRINCICNSQEQSIWLEKGEKFQIIWGAPFKHQESPYLQVKIYNLQKYLQNIKILDRIQLKDGSYEGRIIEKTNDYLLVSSTTKVKLTEMINCLLPDSHLNYSIIDDDTKLFLRKLKDSNLKPDYFILSFIKSAEDVIECKKYLEKLFDYTQISVVSKIETWEAVENIHDIIKVSEKILIGRGDLAPQVGYEKMAYWQKNVTKKACEYNISCIVGTQFLEELAQNNRLCAAEMNDIFCAINQGVAAIMLAGESGASVYANKCIDILKILIDYEERKGDISMKNVIHKTKIMATAGPTLQTKKDFEKAMEMGVTEYRIHMGLRDRDFYSYFVNIREAEKTTKKKVEVLLDLPSSRPRIGKMQERMITVGEIVRFCDSNLISGNLEIIPLTNLNVIYLNINIGDRVVFRDGQVVFKVIEKTDMVIKAKCLISNAILKSNCSSNFPDSKIDYQIIEKCDMVALKKMEKEGLIPDWVAISFASTSQQIKEIREVLQSIWVGERIQVMAKIENQEGINNIDELVNSADGIMVARGDLIVNIDPILLPRVQLNLVNKCKKIGKKVVVATQFFERFALSGIVNRSELSDVALAFREGSDSIMLAMESGNSQFNFECMNYINKIIDYEYSMLKKGKEYEEQKY